MSKISKLATNRRWEPFVTGRRLKAKKNVLTNKKKVGFFRFVLREDIFVSLGEDTISAATAMRLSLHSTQNTQRQHTKAETQT